MVINFKLMKNNQGSWQIQLIIIVLILFLVGYYGSRLVKPYMEYHKLVNIFEEAARKKSVKSEAELRKMIMDDIKDNEFKTIDIKPSDIKVKYDRYDSEIEAKYKVIVKFPFYDYTIIFKPAAYRHRT